MNPSASQGEARLRGLPRAVGVNPSTSQGEARLRGLERIMYSKTISPHEQSHAQQQTMSDVFSHRPTCMSVAAWEAQCSLCETVCWTPKPAADAIVGMRIALDEQLHPERVTNCRRRVESHQAALRSTIQTRRGTRTRELHGTAARRARTPTMRSYGRQRYRVARQRLDC